MLGECFVFCVLLFPLLILAASILVVAADAVRYPVIVGRTQNSNFIYVHQQFMQLYYVGIADACTYIHT